MLKLENLSYQLENGRKLLDSQSFQVVEGEVLVLAGAAACGKSTLMRLLQRDLRPKSGTISMFERILSEISSAQCAEIFQKIGWIGKEQGLVENISVIDNVLLPIRAVRNFSLQSQKDALGLLEWFELHHSANLSAGDLSASEQQKLCIVRALIAKPKLLIADEPFAYLDSQLIGRILGLLQALTKQGMACLILTQKPPVISSTNWRVLQWIEGRLTGEAA